MKSPTYSLWRVTCLVLLASVAPQLLADWTLETTRGSAPRAIARDNHGAVIALYRHGDTVLLEFRVKPGFSGLASTHCPTFQVDTRTPLFHAAVGKRCTVAPDGAVMTLAQVVGQRLESALVDGLLNGEQVAFRYVATDDTYRETRFSLKRSATAIRSAIGRRVRISGK